MAAECQKLEESFSWHSTQFAQIAGEHDLCRGEIVKEVMPPLPLDTPLLLVKPPIGCSTPQIFKVLDLKQCSSQNPIELLHQLSADHTQLAKLCINDLEEPAFKT